MNKTVVMFRNVSSVSWTWQKYIAVWLFVIFFVRGCFSMVLVLGRRSVDQHCNSVWKTLWKIEYFRAQDYKVEQRAFELVEIFIVTTILILERLNFEYFTNTSWPYCVHSELLFENAIQRLALTRPYISHKMKRKYVVF